MPEHTVFFNSDDPVSIGVHRFEFLRDLHQLLVKPLIVRLRDTPLHPQLPPAHPGHTVRVADLHEGFHASVACSGGGEEAGEADEEDKLEHELTEAVLGTLKVSAINEVYIVRDIRPGVTNHG